MSNTTINVFAGESDRAPGGKSESVQDAFFREGALGPNGTYASVMRDGIRTLTDRYGFSPEDAEECRRDLAELFYDLDASPQEAAQIFDAIVRHLKEIPDERTAESWETETRRRLRESFGNDAPNRLKATQEHLSANKQFTGLLARSGVGSHPDVASLLIDLVHRLERRGKRAKSNG